MKGDVSRETFDATKHYSGVRMQQGRVQTDADWNEAEALQRYRTQTEARDVIGRCGAPEDNAGFAISVAGGALRIGAGRFYVDGILCENEVDGLTYESQPDLPGATPWTDALSKAKATAALAYLDVWERHITPLDDPILREVALDGPDTATRVKTVWQVRLLPIAVANDPDKVKALQEERASVQKKIDDLKAQGANPEEIAKLETVIAKIDARLAALGGAPSCGSPFKEWDDLTADPDRRMNARTQPAAPASGPCVVPPTSGYRRLENQLYRVEVHTPGAAGTATFKWSRDNGSVVTAVEKMSGKDITVHDLGPDDVLGFASGQWVEISDDKLELEGKPGQLAQIDAVNSSLRRITLKAAPTPLASGADGIDRALHPKLRRWDQSGASATANGVGMTNAWLALEDGVEVQFGSGTFRTGDYWVIPARTATGEIEWPPFAIPNSAPMPQPPRGIKHHLCRLALLAFDAEKKAWTVSDDCRPIFPPLTQPCCTKDALHIAGTNWSNDDLFPSATLSRDGLRIRLDAAPDPASLTNDSVQVAIEAPYPNSIGIVRVYVEGTVTRDATDQRVIVWMPPREAEPAPSVNAPTTGPTTVSPGATPTVPTNIGTNIGTNIFTNFANNILVNTEVVANPRVRRTRAKTAASSARETETAAATAVASRTTPVSSLCIRVTLKGHLVWSDARLTSKRVFVDGQAFGQPGTRADGKTARTALGFPTGASTKGSDFESWFFIGGREQPTPLQITNVRFLTLNNANSSAGDLKPPLPANQNVTFKAGELIRIAELTFNRAVLASSISISAPSIFIERDDGRTRQKLGVDLQPSGSVVRVVLRNPDTFIAGKYILTCLGTTPPTTVLPLVRAQDDESVLDGDYDNQAGGNFVLPFTSV